MNHLAYFVHRIISRSKMERTNIYQSERTAIVKLLAVLDRAPEDLAVQLSEAEVQAEEWLGPLPATSINSPRL